MSKIAVIGCGWLGLPLAIDLIKQGHTVYGTTTSIDKLPQLSANGIKGEILSLPKIGSDLEDSDLWSCDTFIINIPPGRRNPDFAALYPSRIKVLIDKILRDANDPRILFVSSTGVYKNTGSRADETSPIIEDGTSGLIEAERIVRQATSQNVILRMAGLVGPGRHPGRWFAGKVDIPGGDTPINMVHQEDCISIISKIIRDGEVCGVYNVCGDEHPIKRMFYREMSKQIEGGLPQFQEGLVPFKVVENNKLKERLGFRYRFSNPMRFTYQ